MRKQYFYLLVSLFLLTAPAQAQRGISLPFSSHYDENAWLSLGLQYSYVNSTYRIGLKDGWQKMGINKFPGNPRPETNELYIREFGAIQTSESNGMSVSIPVELRLTDNLSTTFQPSFLFINNGGIKYYDTAIPQDPNAAPQDQLKQGQYVDQPLLRRMRHVGYDPEGTNFNAFDFPLNIKFRSDEKSLKNKFYRYRGYMTGGARYSRWIGIQKEYNGWMGVEEADRAQPLVLKPGYLSWEFGIGAEIFFPYFRMSPEIKFIQSFGDVLDRNHGLSKNNQFMAPLEKTLIRNIQFSLIFQ
ncbi:PorT [Sphingobacterium sp. MYb382]|uniref:PorT n=1 Tax=Sphingobacterium sp. MYb382 TaxID=2745278 RepID=UPI0030AFABE1